MCRLCFFCAVFDKQASLNKCGFHFYPPPPHTKKSAHKKRRPRPPANNVRFFDAAFSLVAVEVGLERAVHGDADVVGLLLR